MKKRDIFLICLALAIGAGAYLKKNLEFNIFALDGCQIHSGTLLDKNNPQAYPPKVLQFPKCATVKLINPAGEIYFSPAGNDQITVKRMITVYHRSKAQADKIFNKISLQANQEADVLILKCADDERFPYQRARVKWEVQIPRAVDLKISNRYGNVEIKDCGQHIEIGARHGDLRIKNCQGKVDVDHQFGQVSLEDISAGPGQLSTAHSNVNIRNAYLGEIDCSHGKLLMNETAGIPLLPESATTGNATVALGQLTISASHMALDVRHLKQSLKLTNAHETVRIDDISGNVELDTRHCQVQISDVRGKIIRAENAYSDLKLASINCDELTISQIHGDVEISGTYANERINVEGNYCDLHMSLPSTQKPTLALKVSYGKILNQSGENYPISRDRHTESLENQAAKPVITIQTRYGDITLTRAESAEMKKI